MHGQPRETMDVLPGFLQPFLTWLTGVPLPDQKPRWLWTPGGRALGAAIVILIGLALGVLGLSATWGLVPLLVVSWLLTTSGMRMLYVVIEHACTHNAFAASPRANRIVGETISTLLWATPYDRFRNDHKVHHHSTRAACDPDVQFLLGTGFRPGMSRDEFRRYLGTTLVSPSYHLSYFRERLRSNFAAPAGRTAMSWAYALALFAGLSATELWLPWLLLWAFPAVVLFQVSSLVNYHSEHRWPQSADSGRLARARLSYGRFCGDPVPRVAGATLLERAGAWSMWWLRVLFVHLPYRLFVLVGDLPQHDLHHRRPGSDWANAAYARRDDIAAGCPGWSEGYTDVWGTALDHLDASIRDWNGQPDPGAAVLVGIAGSPRTLAGKEAAKG